jgi:broad specificity phosphatase PhoE
MPIILVRHGESENNVGNLMGGWTDTPLTDLGLRQADAVARRLKRELEGKPCRIVSSDLRRAMQTAEVIGSALGVIPTPEPGLREINNGAATNLTKEEAKLIYILPTKPLLEWTPYPYAENWLQLHRRVASTMERVYRDIGENLIVVAHGGSIHHIIFWWLRVPIEMIGEINFGLGNTCLTTLSVTALDQRMLVRLNDTSHLVELG